MNPQVIRKPRVDRDLIELYLFIAQDKLEPAEAFLRVAEDSFQRLAHMPSIGRVWQSRHAQLAGVRVYPLPPPYRSYLVFYRMTGNGVEILTVLQGSLDLEAILEELDP
ncbi:MAG TPA: type II toxin-antitoxin system RelE/ParE family toxin [Phycisphaerae bacterium]|nr:type II toxin-antitoxin system RelE/ParE family toxin [Phycisphaerae bacterium]